MRRLPALDGLRALAVAAVVAFHLGLGGASGGFLGVSLFFTLSGYLITSLLLREFDEAGRVSLGGFYLRRWRRLAPSAWVSIGAVLAAVGWWTMSQRDELPGDALASLANVANWRFAFAERSYQDLFIGQPSPLAHFWSLAIEEQFYLVVPLLAVVALRGGRRRFAVVVAVLMAGSITATLLTTDRDLVYNGTHTRAAEILAGVLLALVPPQLLASPTARRAGWFALGAFAVLVAVTHVDDGWVYRGGLVGVAAVSTVLVAALVGSPASLLSRVLSVRPLVAVGTMSYALYLVHWPVFLLLDADRTGLGGLALVVVRVGVALLLAALLTRLVEQPVRERRVLQAPWQVLAASAGAAVVLVVAIVVLPGARYTDNEQLLAAGESGFIEFGVAPAVAAGAAAAPPPVEVAPRVLVLDSDPTLGPSLARRGVDVIDRSDPACPVAPAHSVRLRNGSFVSTGACPGAATTWPQVLAEFDAGPFDAGPFDAVVVAFGPVDAGLPRRQGDIGFAELDALENTAKLEEIGARWVTFEEALVEALGALPPHLLLRLVGTGVAQNDLQLALARVALGDPTIGHVDRTVAGLADDLHDAGAQRTGLRRVLVVGDSTAVVVASALSRAAPDALEVLWVGANGCPFVPVEAVRSSSAEEWASLSCPSFVDLVAPHLDQFGPDAVVLVVSGVELREQRYAGDPRGHVAGDPGYVAVHDAFMAEFVRPLAARGIPLLVGDSPQMRPGPFVSPETAQPSRAAGWNDQVQRWIDRWPSVQRFPLAALIDAREAQVGTIRPDGIHVDVVELARLVEPDVVPLVLSARTVRES